MGSFFDDLGATVSSIEDKVVATASDIGDSISSTVTSVEGGLADGLSAVEGTVEDIAGGIGGALTTAGGAISGALGGIGSAISGIGGALGGIVGALGNIGKPVSLGLPMPLPNPLFNYASYNYILGLSSISMDYYTRPDSTYMKGQPGVLICKSGSISPDNRVSTPWGKTEFYIEDLETQHQVGHENGSNNNLVGKITMKIIEPYSIGMLFDVLQIAAQQNHKGGNWRDTPFLLSIEFKGNSETGSMLNIKGCNRYIPVKLLNCDMKVSEKGAEYTITAQPFNDQSLMDYNSKLKGDHSARGSTVIEMLQAGPKSLQSVINARLQQVAETNKLQHPDRILILFPVDGASSQDLAPANNAGEDAPTVDVTKSEGGLFQQLGIAAGQFQPDSLIQFTPVNPIGRAKMKFNDDHSGDTPVGKDQKVYDASGKNARRGANTTNIKESDMKFSQDTDITNAINQVIMMSDFVDKTLDPTNLSKEGYREWWSIHTQTYPLQYNVKGGETAKVHVYRVIPYKVHASSAPTDTNTTAPGLDTTKKGGLADQAVKRYDYIYTGKNVDIIKFDINFKYNFYNDMPADGISGTIDAKLAAKSSSGSAPALQSQPLGDGKPPETKTGFWPSVVRFVKTVSGTDKLGGGGVETQSSRVGRYFHDSITKGNDMINLNMEIIGDPYYIVQTGTGNYISKATSDSVNLCADGSMNHLSGEVDIVLNFRNPVDINQGNGLYDFGKNSGAPIQQFSGIYRVLLVTSKFSKNHFTQTLKLNRRPTPSTTVATKDQVYGNKAAKNPKDPANKDGPNANAGSSGPDNQAGTVGLPAGVNAIVGEAAAAAQNAIGAVTNIANQATSLVSSASNVASQIKGGIGKLF